MSVFKKATKKQARLRMAIIGPSGAGKTYSALRIGQGLLKEGERMAFIDTERGSAAKYSDKFDFDVLELESFEPERYTDAIQAAVEAEYTVLVIDSLSHAWAGKGGILEFIDREKQRSSGGNSFNVWGKATPKQNAMIDSILRAPIHIIVTMRSKMEYVQEKDDRGKTVVRKVGLQPVQRDGLEYEFDIVGDVNTEHSLIISKTRMEGIDGEIFEKPGEELGRRIRAWLTDGEPVSLKEEVQNIIPEAKEIERPAPQENAPVKPQWFDFLQEQCREGDITQADIARFLNVEKATGKVIQGFIDECLQSGEAQTAEDAVILLVGRISKAAADWAA